MNRDRVQDNRAPMILLLVPTSDQSENFCILFLNPLALGSVPVPVPVSASLNVNVKG